MGGRMADGRASWVRADFDMTYIRCREEVPYVLRLRDLLADVRVALEEGRGMSIDDLLVLPSVEGEETYFFNRRYWHKDLWDEARIRRRDHVFWGWHNVEYHALTHADRKALFAPTTTRFAEYLEAHPFLSVPSPWV